MQPVLKVKVLSPLQNIYEGDAKSVSSDNVSGPFSILPGHAQFITILEKRPIVITDTNNKTYTYGQDSTCVLYTIANRVIIFTNKSGAPGVKRK